jgi:NADPH:quinone reductase-like Zn-dependent oxidoreductase
MKQWSLTGTDKDFDGLAYGDAPVPSVGENEVLVKLHAASLNYRDLVIPKVCCAYPKYSGLLAFSGNSHQIGNVPVPPQVPRCARI